MATIHIVDPADDNIEDKLQNVSGFFFGKIKAAVSLVVPA